MGRPAQAPVPDAQSGHDEDFAASELDELIRAALEGLGEEMLPAGEPARAEAVDGEPIDLEALDTDARGDPAHDGASRDDASRDDPAENDAAREEPLETVELELALHNQNVVSLGFEESIRTALHDLGGEILFQMRVENDDCQRIAAVRVGQGENRQFALVIMPPGGGLMRVEPVERSTNPLARITESYAGLMDVFRAAA
jgi:hypothetical protein